MMEEKSLQGSKRLLEMGKGEERQVRGLIEDERHWVVQCTALHSLSNPGELEICLERELSEVRSGKQLSRSQPSTFKVMRFRKSQNSTLDDGASAHKRQEARNRRKHRNALQKRKRSCKSGIPLNLNNLMSNLGGRVRSKHCQDVGSSMR